MYLFYTILNIITSRILIYALLSFFAIIAIFWGGTNEHIADWSKNVFENNYWPIVVFLYELYRSKVDKYFSDRNKMIIEKVKTAIGGGNLSAGHLLAILSGKDSKITNKIIEDFFNEKLDKSNPFKN